MKPIPLTSPSGKMYAYACGRCHHIPSMGSMLIADDEYPYPDDLERSLEYAKKCCTCSRCGQDQRDDRRIGECERCRLWSTFVHEWMVIATCKEHGLLSKADYQRWWQKTYEGDDE